MADTLAPVGPLPTVTVVAVGNPITGYDTVTAVRLDADRVLTTDGRYKLSRPFGQPLQPWPTDPDSLWQFCKDAVSMLTDLQTSSQEKDAQSRQDLARKLTDMWMEFP